jgi:hypothetical protein
MPSPFWSARQTENGLPFTYRPLLTGRMPSVLQVASHRSFLDGIQLALQACESAGREVAIKAEAKNIRVFMFPPGQ